ncbi:MAG: hypothetical protein WAW77_08175, partial [Caldibacillus thermoamylovorans]
TITVVGLGVTGKSFFVYAQKFSAGLCIFPLQSSALLFCHTHVCFWQVKNASNGHQKCTLAKPQYFPSSF